MGLTESKEQTDRPYIFIPLNLKKPNTSMNFFQVYNLMTFKVYETQYQNTIPYHTEYIILDAKSNSNTILKWADIFFGNLSGI